MPTSITAYTTFTSGTTISSSEVNTNFSNHRGDLIPINTDTATASNLTHGIGTAEHRYAESFVEKVNYGQTTTSWRVEDDTTTVGDLVFKLNGSTVAKINSGGFDINSYTTTAVESYTATSSDVFVNYDSTLTAGAVILPAAASGKVFEIRKLDTTFNAVTIQGDTNTVSIDGSTTTTLNTQNEVASFIADASDWYIKSRRIESKFKAYTPTLVGFGTVTSLNAVWRRVGDSIELLINFNLGTSTATEAQCPLPVGLTIDSTAVPALKCVGYMSVQDSVSNQFAMLATGGDAFLNFGLQAGAVAGLDPKDGNQLVSNTSKVSFFATVPVTGWES